MSRYLLDTHVVVWLHLGRTREVPTLVADTLSDPDNEVLLSAGCLWEIAIKRSVDELDLEDNWAAQIAGLGFRPLPVTAAHAVAVERLPLHHRDPFDRILVAQAEIEDAVLVTADRRLDAYDVQTLWSES